MKKIPKVTFETERLTSSVLADLERQIRMLPEINERNLDDFYDLALRSIADGGDLQLFSTGILAMHISGMTRKRAAQISTGIWLRAIGKAELESQLKLGITHARWMYANAFCMPNPKAPSAEDLRRDAEHKAANGQIYPLVEGLVVKGRRIWPGDEDGCKCSSTPIMKGFEE